MPIERIVSLMFFCWPVNVLLYQPPTPTYLNSQLLHYISRSLTWYRILTPQNGERGVSLSTAGLLKLSTAPPPWWMVHLQFTTWSLLILCNFLSGLLEGIKYFFWTLQQPQKHNKRVTWTSSPWLLHNAIWLRITGQGKLIPDWTEKLFS